MPVVRFHRWMDSKELVVCTRFYCRIYFLIHPAKQAPFLFLSILPSEHQVTERTKYQQNIIKNYYNNRENIALQRAQEIVTELYLSDGKKREKYWISLAGHLLKLEVKQEAIDKLIEQDDPQLVAKLLEKIGKD